MKNKYAVVTGGAKGIGRAVVERFIKEDIGGIAILDYDGETAAKTVKELDPNGEKLIFIQCDIGDHEAVEKSFSEVYQRFERIDILVNNAGVTRDAMLHKMTLEQWDTAINIDLSGVFYCMKQVIPHMREQKYGKIVNISSTSAYGNVGQANYAAAKAGLLGLTATAAKELGRKNITVNSVAPGYIDTDILKTIPEEILAQYIESIPCQRLGKPSEVAGVVFFLSCDDSSFVSGNCILCCGGSLIEF